MSWRGLDGMARAQEQTRTRADEVLTLQVGLAQWSADLDAIDALPRATRWTGTAGCCASRAAAPPAPPTAVLVVGLDPARMHGARWLRWQSPPADHARRAGAGLAAGRPVVAGRRQRASARREVAITPLQDWQIFYYRDNAWTNPLSGDVAAAERRTPGAAAAPGLPDGVRLVLELPPGRALAGAAHARLGAARPREAQVMTARAAAKRGAARCWPPC